MTADLIALLFIVSCASVDSRRSLPLLLPLLTAAAVTDYDDAYVLPIATDERSLSVVNVIVN